MAVIYQEAAGGGSPLAQLMGLGQTIAGFATGNYPLAASGLLSFNKSPYAENPRTLLGLYGLYKSIPETDPMNKYRFAKTGSPGPQRGL